jgi:hypothetical protein
MLSEIKSIGRIRVHLDRKGGINVHKLSVVAICLTLFASQIVLPVVAAHSDAADNNIDPVYIKLSQDQLGRDVFKELNDLDALQKTLRRAIYQGEGAIAYEDMTETLAEHPGNTCMEQGMYFVETVASGKYMPMFGSRIKGIPETVDFQRPQQLAAILKADPKPWLALLIDGQEQFCIFRNFDKGITELQEAVKDAPSSAYAHVLYGWVLAGPHTPYTDSKKAAAEEETAFALDPRCELAAMALFDLNIGALNDRSEALKWKAVVISLTPGGESGLDPITRKLLDRYN